MNPNLKKAFLIIGFLIVTVLIAYGLYRFFFYQAPTAVPTVPTAGAPTGQFPTAGQLGQRPTTPTVPGGGGAVGLPSARQNLQVPGFVQTQAPRTVALTDTLTRAISLSPSGSGVRSFDPISGKFFKTADDGTTTPMSDQQFFNVDQVYWGNQTDKAVITYPDGSKILYDFNADKQYTLPKHWEDFAFSPQDDKIVTKAVGNNENNRFLVIANPDGTDAKAVEELGDNQDLVHASWSPSSQTVAYSFTGDPLGYDRQAVVLVGQHRENFKNLIVEGRGLVPSWSPTGDNLLYSVYDSGSGYEPTLWISGAIGDNINSNRRKLNIQTWADKCTWQDEATIYCAVPTSLPEGAGLQRELATAPDKLVKINVADGSMLDMGVPSGSPTISKLLVSPDGKSLYFNDSQTGKLMKFTL